MWKFLCIVLALSPTYLLRFHVAGIPFTVFEILILILVAAEIVTVVQAPKEKIQRLQKIPRAIKIAVGLFIIAGIISIFVAPNLMAAAGIFRAYILEALVVGGVAFLEYKNSHQLKELAAAASVPVFLVSVYAIFQMITGWGIPNSYWAAPATRRATSVFGYPNAIGLYVEFLIPFLIVAGYLEQKKMRVWFWGVTFLAIIAFLCGKSAGASAAVFGTALIYLLVWKKTRAKVAIGILFCTILIAITPLRTPFAKQFLFQGFSGGLRIQMWKETAQLLQQRPLVGAGLAGYETRVAPFHTNKHVEIYLYPHNLILTLWSELGLLGLLSFSFIFGYTVWRLAHIKFISFEENAWRLALLAVFCTLFIHGIVDIPYFKNDFAAWYWVIVALSMGLLVY